MSRYRLPILPSVMRALFAMLVALVCLSGPAVRSAVAQPAADVAWRSQPHVEALAADRLEGRLTGSEGERLAADYLVSELEAIGATPLPGQADFRLAFGFTAGVDDAGSSLSAKAGDAVVQWSGHDEVHALSFSDNGAITGPVVFAGYGLDVPESGGFSYDSYATLDVTDKVVLVLRYVPEDADQATRAILSRYAGLRYKALAARQRGAKALLIVTGPRSPNAGETIPMTFDTAISGSGIVAASISGEVAEAIFNHVPDATLEQAQASLDTANPHVTGFEIPGLELTVETAVTREHREAHNIVGYLPPTTEPAAPEPYVLIGAHYDHLGRGGHGNSLARKDEAGGIHNGADDNASGVTAVLLVAGQLAEAPRARGVAIAFWSGEELGVLGSTDFVKTAPVPIDEIAAYLNFDMVGRMQNNTLVLQAVGSSPVWPTLIEQANGPAGFDVQSQDDPYLPTDVSSLNQASVPSLNFFTGSHSDYHRPSDDPEAINYADLDRIVDFGADIATRVVNLEAAPEFVRVARSTEGGDRDTLRVFTGTIPDYATDVEGLLLSGVIEGGPADEAGLAGGDVIVQFGSQTITNIYDYTYALDAVKIDEPLTVVYIRDGERRETTLTPRARK